MNDWDIRTLIDLGVSAVLIAALLSGSRGVWVYGRSHQEVVRHLLTRIDQLIEERDQWRRMALRGTDVAEKAVAVAARKGD